MTKDTKLLALITVMIKSATLCNMIYDMVNSLTAVWLFDVFLTVHHSIDFFKLPT